MPAHIHMVLDDKEKDHFRSAAQAEGLSLSSWLRRAGRERIRKQAEARRPRDIQGLERFWAQIDRSESGREPDWEETKRLLDESLDPLSRQ